MLGVTSAGNIRQIEIIGEAAKHLETQSERNILISLGKILLECATS
jgi:uncharacterized protein with HEPN domain